MELAEPAVCSLLHRNGCSPLPPDEGKRYLSISSDKEINPETYAICKADMLLKGDGDQAEHISYGSTLSLDGNTTRLFDFMLSNPPYGKSWKTDTDKMGGKKDILDSRFNAYLEGGEQLSMIPRVSDGQLLFLLNNVAKMKRDTPLGSRIAEVHNGSSLFTGDAGSGESNARRFLIENDLVEAIIALPGNMFYNQYHVVSSANDMALETHSDHNFILVLTPERLLYLLNDRSDFVLDYLFIDEAHKMTGRNSRAPFYYSVVDELSRRSVKPHFIFASPNIPNPQEYLTLLSSGEYDRQNAVASSFSPVAQFKFLVNLKTKQIYIYNDHLKTLEYICSINSDPEQGVVPLMGVFYKNRGDKPSRMIAYFSSKDKAINAALAFARLRRQIDGPGQKQPDPELLELAKEVRNQVHKDYFLASLLEQGIAYHIGYLPSAIRMRIEKLFKAEKITAMFCTSTLVEGVNLPADNLFITSYYSGRAQMTDVDFRNLVGRVGRIQYNLSRNVFMVSDETRNNKQEVYLDKLKDGIPDQHLSLIQDLKPKHKRKIVATLLSGSSVIDKYDDNRPEEEYIMMRKFGLILLKDIVHGNDSLVTQEFDKYMKPEDKDKIKSAFSVHAPIIDNDINISLDQTSRLRAAIAADSTFSYPLPETDGSFSVDKAFDFLVRLGDIFDWKRYEYSTLGKCDTAGNYTKLRWYSVILIQWLEGKGLNNIMRRAVDYQERHPDMFWVTRYTKMYYDRTSLEHRNIVFANTLEVIENVILFSISNYFLRFSNEYMRVHGKHSLNRNNWYEYVEYGTTNEVTIQLQRYGFSRESATYIKAHQAQYVVIDDDGNVHIKNSMEQCGDAEVVRQIPDIRFNTPELFID